MRDGALPTRFAYLSTEDPNLFAVVLRLGETPVGLVWRTVSGWAYRSSETIPWTFGPRGRREAALALCASLGLVGSFTALPPASLPPEGGYAQP